MPHPDPTFCAPWMTETAIPIPVKQSVPPHLFLGGVNLPLPLQVRGVLLLLPGHLPPQQAPADGKDESCTCTRCKVKWVGRRNAKLSTKGQVAMGAPQTILLIGMGHALSPNTSAPMVIAAASGSTFTCPACARRGGGMPGARIITHRGHQGKQVTRAAGRWGGGAAAPDTLHRPMGGQGRGYSEAQPYLLGLVPQQPGVQRNDDTIVAPALST
jgi:hypothetical protein